MDYGAQQLTINTHQTLLRGTPSVYKSEARPEVRALRATMNNVCDQRDEATDRETAEAIADRSVHAEEKPSHRQMGKLQISWRTTTSVVRAQFLQRGSSCARHSLV